MLPRTNPPSHHAQKKVILFYKTPVLVMLMPAWHNLATTMAGFNAPLGQNILTSMRIQAEQAHRLVEDIRSGSQTASIELMDLAGQLAARARTSNLTRVSIWASALEERLAKISGYNGVSSEDLDWLARHVTHFDALLDSPLEDDSSESDDFPEEDIEIGSLELELDLDDDEDFSLDELVSFENEEEETSHNSNTTGQSQSGAIPLAIMKAPEQEQPTPAAPAPSSQEPSSTAIPLAVLKKATESDDGLPGAAAGRPEPPSSLPPPIPFSSIPQAVPGARAQPEIDDGDDDDDDEGDTEIMSVAEALKALTAKAAPKASPEPPPAPEEEEDDDFEEPEIETLSESDLDPDERAMLDTIGSADYDGDSVQIQLEPIAAGPAPEEAAAADDAAPAKVDEPSATLELAEVTEAEADTQTRSVLAKLKAGELTEAEIDTQTRSVLTALEKDEVLQAEIDSGERAFLAKVDIKRISAPVQTQTEIQGPHQYIVVSISEDPEVHLWLSKMLPERRFELLAARGAAEAEVLCLENQPDLVLAAWNSGDNLAQTALDRLRANPLTSYVRSALVTEDESLANHLAAIRLGSMGVISRAAKPKDIFSRVLLCVVTPTELPEEHLGETTMNELSELLLQELKTELQTISESIGDGVVPVGGGLGKVLRDTSMHLRDGIQLSLGTDSENGKTGRASITPDEAKSLFTGKRALILEADRLRRAELARVFGELGLEILPPQPDLTKALEAGLTWAPDLLIGGTPKEDSLNCARILKRDIALSGMLSIAVKWPNTNREWPNARADVFAIKDELRRELLDTFAPLNELVRQLDGTNVVKGRVESCGMLSLIRLIVLKRGQGLLEVSEGTDQMKAWFKDGKLLDATWTETDGTETKDRDAFFRLLTVDRGRFKISALTDEPEQEFSGTIGELLADACRWWRPLSLTIDRRLPAIRPLELDRRRTGELKRQTGKLFRQVVAALAKQKMPKEIVEEGVDPSVVAHVLRELVRRFVVTELPVPPAKGTRPPKKKKKS